MKSKKIILGLLLLIPSIIHAAHTSQRKLFATDIVNKVGTPTFYFPTALPTASRVCEYNADREITSSSVTSTELGYLSGVTSAIQTQLDAKQASDSDLSTIAGLTATTDNFLQAKSSAWASRTPTQVTADLIAMVGDSGSGGTKGLVPAPASGDAAAGKFLKADGTWATAGGSPSLTNTYVGFGASSVLSGDSEFTWDNTNKILRLDRTAAGTGAQMLHLTHGSQTGTGTSDGFYMGYPSANNSNFAIRYREGAQFEIYYGNNSVWGCGSSTCVMANPAGGAASISVDGNEVTTFNKRLLISQGLSIQNATLTSSSNALDNASATIQFGNTASNNVTGILNPATGTGNRRQTWFFSKSSADNNTFIADGNSSETIDGFTDQSLYSVKDGMMIVSDNSANRTVLDARAPRMLSVTGNTTLTDTHRDITVLCNATSGNVTVTGYSIAGHKGWKVTVKKTDASANTCGFTAPTGAGDGTGWTTATQYAGKTIQFDGTDSWIVGSF